jgi:hypothetical protein
MGMLISRGVGEMIVSNAVRVPEGARATLLHVPERFRLDVQLRGDTFRTILRGLGPGKATIGGPGYSRPVISETPLGEHAASRHDVLVTLEDSEIPVLIGTLQDPATSVVTFSAQARLPAT